MNRRAVIRDSLGVGLAVGVSGVTVTPVTLNTIGPRGGPSASRLNVALANPDGPGRAEFGFDNAAGQICYGDLTGTDFPIVLTDTPHTFRLTGLHTDVSTEPAG